MTLSDRLTATRGRPTGFDYLRIGLAVGVVGWHTIVTSYGFDVQSRAWGTAWRPLISSILPMFFALSGFLVAGSLDRTPELSKFLGLRALRILPALAVETILSAFLIGPLLTSYAASHYFSDPQFRSYLLNMLGIVHMHLPGVFNANPLPHIVNGQLWTVPFELQCYLALAAFAFLGIASRRNTLFVILLALQIVLLAVRVAISHGHEGTVLHGRLLVLTFLAGVALYTQRERVPLSPVWFLVSLALMIIGLSVPLMQYLTPYPVAYVTVWLGMTNFKATALHKLGDLSYGIFLYGFPLQQWIMTWGPWTHHWYVNFIIALPLASAVALVSWNVVEKPCLRLKKHLGFLRPIDAALERIKNAGAAGRQRMRVAYVNTNNVRDGDAASVSPDR